MSYEINVSLKGNHLFRTAMDSIPDTFTAGVVLRILRKKFTKKEGYDIHITLWNTSGQDVTDKFED